MGQATQELKPFAILVSNGFNFEFYCTVQAASAQQARANFLMEHSGAWYAKPEMIRARDDSKRAA